MYTGRKSVKTGRLFDQSIIYGSSDFRPISKSAETSAKIKFGFDQNSAEINQNSAQILASGI